LATEGPYTNSTLALHYDSIQDYRRMAGYLGLMSDVKSGVPRGGYNGIVTVRWKGDNTLLLIPSNGPPDESDPDFRKIH
jgi:hypothetical protein